MNAPWDTARIRDLVRVLRLDARPHSGRTLLEHLCGVHDQLGRWGAEPSLMLAGLFHSVYDANLIPPDESPRRVVVRDAIGEEAERLASLFCTVDRERFLDDIGSRAALDTGSNGSIEIVTGDERSLAELVLANEVEILRDGIPSAPRRRPLPNMLAAVSEHVTPAARRDVQEWIQRCPDRALPADNAVVDAVDGVPRWVRVHGVMWRASDTSPEMKLIGPDGRSLVAAGTGPVIWEALEQPRSQVELIKEMTTLYGPLPPEAHQQIEDFLNQLAATGLIESTHPPDQPTP